MEPSRLRRLALAILLLATPLDAQAAGVGIRWNSCKGESNRMFACDRSTGSEVLVGSFVSPTTMNLSGVEVYLRVTTADGNTPSWWGMGTGGCRTSSLSAQFDVSMESDCDDPWLGQASGGIGYYGTSAGANWPGQSQSTPGVFLRMAMAVPVAAVHAINGNTHYAAFRLLINHSRSSGPGACEGCSTPACISIDVMRLTTPTDTGDHNQVSRSRDVELTTAITGMSAGNVAMWQGGTPTCGAGAAKSSTWAEVKRRFSK
jgi:hypothetical protein